MCLARTQAKHECRRHRRRIDWVDEPPDLRRFIRQTCRRITIAAGQRGVGTRVSIRIRGRSARAGPVTHGADCQSCRVAAARGLDNRVLATRDTAGVSRGPARRQSKPQAGEAGKDDGQDDKQTSHGCILLPRGLSANHDLCLRIPPSCHGTVAGDGNDPRWQPAPRASRPGTHLRLEGAYHPAATGSTPIPNTSKSTSQSSIRSGSEPNDPPSRDIRSRANRRTNAEKLVRITFTPGRPCRPNTDPPETPRTPAGSPPQAQAPSPHPAASHTADPANAAASCRPARSPPA